MARPENGLGLQEAMLTVCHAQLLPSQPALDRQQPACGLVWPFAHCPLPGDPRNTRAGSQDQLHTSLRLLRPICSCRQPRAHPKCRFCSKISAQAAFPFPAPCSALTPRPQRSAGHAAASRELPKSTSARCHSLQFTTRGTHCQLQQTKPGHTRDKFPFPPGTFSGDKSANRPQKWFQIGQFMALSCQLYQRANHPY